MRERMNGERERKREKEREREMDVSTKENQKNDKEWERRKGGRRGGRMERWKVPPTRCLVGQPCFCCRKSHPAYNALTDRKRKDRDGGLGVSAVAAFAFLYVRGYSPSSINQLRKILIQSDEERVCVGVCWYVLVCCLQNEKQVELGTI